MIAPSGAEKSIIKFNLILENKTGNNQHGNIFSFLNKIINFFNLNNSSFRILKDKLSSSLIIHVKFLRY